MVVAPAAPAWPKPAAGQPTVVLPVRHGSAEHSYLRNFPDWEQATRLTFELGLAIATQKLDRRGEGIELAALQKRRDENAAKLAAAVAAATSAATDGS